MNQTVRQDIKQGFYKNIPNEAYHAGPGISKSGLWTIHEKTPAHFKFPPEKEETTASKAIKDFGSACHVAILEPALFEKSVVRGPADRKGNKWTDLVAACALDNRILLTSKQYDDVLAMRDAVHADPWINSILSGGVAEGSAYWTDEETGELCRCRPDYYREDLGIILDVKSTESAHPDAFARSVSNYGYHAQEAFYSDGMNAIGKPVNGFVFIAWEKKSPYAFAVYELPPSIVEEGRATMRKALATYSECRKADEWPGYPAGVQELSFKRWAYRLTEAPAGEMEAA